MGRLKLLLDTNVVIDFLHERDPHYAKTRLLMMAGRVGEWCETVCFLGWYTVSYDEKPGVDIWEREALVFFFDY